MEFLGIDLGWSGKPSGLARLRWDGEVLRLVDLDRRENRESILEWVDESGSGPAMVAVDAPMVVPNASGKRVPDRAAHVHFGKYHAGCYPANQASSFYRNTSAFEQALVVRGFRHAAAIEPGSPGRYVIEVYPNAAIVQLFDLGRIIRYKRGRLAVRAEELARYRELLLGVLPQLTPALVDFALPAIPAGGQALKDLEDRLDALMCAYSGAYWWYWGLERNLVLGSAAEGYIVVPERVRPAE